MIERGDWQVSDIARNAYDLENKVVGTIGAGRYVSACSTTLPSLPDFYLGH